MEYFLTVRLVKGMNALFDIFHKLTTIYEYD